MKDKSLNYNKLILIFWILMLFAPIISSCNAEETLPILEYDGTGFYEKEFSKCEKMPNTGLPVEEQLLDTKIIFSVETTDNKRQIWAYHLMNNEFKVVKDLDGFRYAPKIGLLKDHYHIILSYDNEYFLTDIEGSPLKKLNNDAENLKRLTSNIPTHSQLWYAINGIDYASSSNGDKTAYWVPDSEAKLLLIDNKTGETTELFDPNNSGFIYSVWSPDDKKLFFINNSSIKHGGSSIYLVNPNSRDVTERVHFSGNLYLYRPMWAPDGQKIVYEVQKFVNNSPILLHIYNIHTGELSEYPVDVNLGNNISGPIKRDIIWSPDSQWILFFTKKYIDFEWDYEIELINIDTKAHYCLTNNNLREMYIDWN